MGNLTICLTHDVDRVRKTYQYLTHDVKKLRFKNLFSVAKSITQNPYWCFDRIMDVEASFNVRSTFFFLNETIPINLFRPSSYKLSIGRYSFEKPEIKNIIRLLDHNGWEIGLHGSYNSYLNGNLLKQEKAFLEEVLDKNVIGIRQHYLNLKIPETLKLQKQAGFKYDASYGKIRGLGYLNDQYIPFVERESGMIIIPLAMMECNLFSNAGGEINKAWSIAKEQMDKAEKNDAVFTILWHQRVFNENDFPGYLLLYKMIIEEGVRRGAYFKTCGQLFTEYANN